jgi:hypothetical protein
MEVILEVKSCYTDHIENMGKLINQGDGRGIYLKAHKGTEETIEGFEIDCLALDIETEREGYRSWIGIEISKKEAIEFAEHLLLIAKNLNT